MIDKIIVFKISSLEIEKILPNKILVAAEAFFCERAKKAIPKPIAIAETELIKESERFSLILN